MNRNPDETCRTCPFFWPTSGNEPSKELNEVGECREKSPTVEGFPATESDKWCRAHPWFCRKR
jgi:hypothetical protein